MCKEKTSKEDFVSRFGSVVVSEEDKKISKLIDEMNSVREFHQHSLDSMLLDLETINKRLDETFDRIDILPYNKVCKELEKIAALKIRICLIKIDIEKQFSLKLEDVLINDKSIDFLKETIKRSNEAFSQNRKKITSLIEEVGQEVNEIEKIISDALST